MAFLLHRFFALALMTVLTAGAQPVAPKGWSANQKDGKTTFQPGDLKAGETLFVAVDPPVAVGGDLRAFARERVPGRMASRCQMAQSRPAEASCTVNASEGMHFFYGIRSKGGQDSFVHVFTGPSAMTAIRYGFAVQQILDAVAASPGTSVETSAAPAPAAGPAPTLALEGLYLHLAYRSGMGGGVYPVYVPHVLFRDGTMTEDLSYYPASATDIANWRRKNPRDWGRWTRAGNTIKIQWDDPKRKPDTWEKWFVARGGAAGQRLQGKYRSITGGGNTALGGDAMVVAWGTLDFQPDGTVMMASGAGASNSGANVSGFICIRIATARLALANALIRSGNSYKRRKLADMAWNSSWWAAPCAAATRPRRK
jgi:hypothetical protein